MDQQSQLLATFVKRTIISNLMKLTKDNPNYCDIVKGGCILWKNYYIDVLLGYATYAEISQHFNNILYCKLEKVKYIKAYIDMFGKFWEI